MNMKFKIKLLLLIVVFAITCPDNVKPDHYRGTVLTSEWNNLVTLINLKAQVYYKRIGGSNGVYCDDSYIQNQVFVTDGPGITFYLRKCNETGFCGVNINTFENKFICSSFSTIQNWAIVDKLENIFSSLISENEYVNIYFETAGGLWTGFNYPYTANHVSKKVRNKNGPKTKAFPQFDIVKGCPASLKIPVEDPDDNVIKCHPSLAVGLFGKKECEYCQFSKTIRLKSDTCILYVPSNLTSSQIIELQIENFANAPMSSVPFQFAVTLVNNPGITCDIPVFTQVDYLK
jgi:hypothetical protein